MLSEKIEDLIRQSKERQEAMHVLTEWHKPIARFIKAKQEVDMMLVSEGKIEMYGNGWCIVLLEECKHGNEKALCQQCGRSYAN